MSFIIYGATVTAFFLLMTHEYLKDVLLDRGINGLNCHFIQGGFGLISLHKKLCAIDMPDNHTIEAILKPHL